MLGRVARADEHISEEETKAMEKLLAEHGGLPPDQAMLVVSIAKTTNLMFGASADFAITQEFTDATTYADRVALARCLMAIGAALRHEETAL